MRDVVAKVLAAVLLVAGAGLLVTGGPAHAVDDGPTPSAAGWWWQPQSSSLPAALPAPPGVAPGQLLVQGDPNGKAAFAAVRYDLPGGRTNPVLTLHVAGGSAQSALLLACLTGSAWSSVDAGPWDQAPKVDPDHCVNGQVAADGTTVTFALGPLQAGDLVDVAVVPGSDPSLPDGLGGSTFQVTFAAPAAGDLQTQAGTPPVPSTATSLPTSSPPAAAGSGGSTGAGSSARPPAVPAYHPPAPVAVAAPALPPANLGVTATAPAARAASTPLLPAAATTTATLRPVGRWPGLLVLGLGGVLAAYALGRQRSQEATEVAVAGGLGRFTADRLGSPPPLR